MKNGKMIMFIRGIVKFPVSKSSTLKYIKCSGVDWRYIWDDNHRTTTITLIAGKDAEQIKIAAPE